MAAQTSRPFYGEYAWAFDLLIDRPVRQECAAITAWLIERVVTPGATLLDAGCGTGRYAGELARRGYAVDARRSVFTAFAGSLRRGGVLILDVRDWEATKERKQREPVFRKSVETDRGKLTFTSITELASEHHELLLSETHTLVNDAGEHSSDYRFVMRCWTRRELESVFVRSGFRSVAYFGSYDPVVPAGATDRLVAVAQLSEDVAIRTT